jgi:hypothetical protein
MTMMSGSDTNHIQPFILLINKEGRPYRSHLPILLVSVYKRIYIHINICVCINICMYIHNIRIYIFTYVIFLLSGLTLSINIVGRALMIPLPNHEDLFSFWTKFTLTYTTTGAYVWIYVVFRYMSLI